MRRWPSPDTPNEDMRIPVDRVEDIDRIEQYIRAARGFGLSRLTLVVKDSMAPARLDAVVATVREHRRQANSPEVGVAMEARITSDEGHISVAALPAGVDALYVTMDRLPMGMVCVSPLELREAFEEGRTSAMSMVRRAVGALEAAMRRNRGLVLSRPFSLLTRVGIPEDWIGIEALKKLARTARRTGASLQVDEWDRSPRTMAAETFAAAGVPILFGTGTREPEGVGVYDYVGRLIRRRPALVRGAGRAEPLALARAVVPPPA